MCFRLKLGLGVFLLAMMTSPLPAVHNPALSAESVILLSHPASSTPPVTVNITWPSGSTPPTSGRLTATVQNGTERVAILDENGEETSTRSWDGSFPPNFQIRAKAKSAAPGDVVLNIQHDSGPVGSKIFTVSAPSITAPSETQDGSESGAFNVEIIPTSVVPDSYEWVYVLPSGAGRVPTGDIFDDKTKKQPKVSAAKWFAPTNNEDRTIDLPTCVYKIKCRIRVGSSDYESAEADWRVWTYKHPETSRPSIKAGSNILEVSITGDANSLTATVTGHDLVREGPSVAPDGMLDTNSFYGKIITSHAGRHMLQWTSMTPWSDYYSPGKVYGLFAGKKKTGSFNDISTWQSGLRTQAAQVLARYVTLCTSEANRTHHHREHDAHAISNPVGPAYLRSNYAVEYPNVQTPVGNAPEPTL